MVLLIGKRTTSNLLMPLNSSRQSSSFPLWHHHQGNVLSLFTSLFQLYVGQSIQEWTKSNLWKADFKKLVHSLILCSIYPIVPAALRI